MTSLTTSTDGRPDPHRARRRPRSPARRRPVPGQARRRRPGPAGRAVMLCLLADGHCLIEGFPGLAKTLTVSTMAQAVGGDFARLQFTPDLVPADLVGTRIWRPSRENFDIEWGPVFANIVLADEINRAPAKVQSALLEAMAERHVTIAGETRPLPTPVPRPRHAEPDRVRGRVRPAGGPARPVPHARRRAAADVRGGGGDRAAHGRPAPAGRAGADDRAAASSCRRGAQRLRPPRGAGLCGASRHGDPRARALGPGRPVPAHLARLEPPRHARSAGRPLAPWRCCAAAGTSSRRTSTTWRPRFCGTGSRSPTTRWPRACTPRRSSSRSGHRRRRRVSPRSRTVHRSRSRRGRADHRSQAAG